jgi:hypothetical protein
VVIPYLNVIGVTVPPPETDTPLVVDAYAVFTNAMTLELLEPVSRRQSQVSQSLRRIKYQEFS